MDTERLELLKELFGAMDTACAGGNRCRCRLNTLVNRASRWAVDGQRNKILYCPPRTGQAYLVLWALLELLVLPGSIPTEGHLSAGAMTPKSGLQKSKRICSNGSARLPGPNSCVFPGEPPSLKIIYEGGWTNVLLRKGRLGLWDCFAGFESRKACGLWTRVVHVPFKILNVQGKDV